MWANKLLHLAAFGFLDWHFGLTFGLTNALLSNADASLELCRVCFCQDEDFVVVFVVLFGFERAQTLQLLLKVLLQPRRVARAKNT